MQPGEDRVRSFHRHLADGAIGTAVDLFNEKSALCTLSEFGIEFDCGFHFDFSLFLGIDLAQREQGKVHSIELVQGPHQSSLVSDVPGKDHFTVLQ